MSVMETTTEQKPTYEELELSVHRLRFENNNLKRLIFGQKRERFIPEQNENQASFLPAANDTSPKPQTEHISYTRKKRAKKKKTPVRQAIPAHIPRKEIIIEPDEDIAGMKKIGQEVTEELEYTPGKFFVNCYIRPKYARAKDGGIAIGALPVRPIEKGIAGPGLLAHITISKFVDHLPLYRQIQQFKRLGLDLADSTINGWVKATDELVEPLVNLQKNTVLQSNYLMVDETPIKVLDPEKKGKTHQGYYWVYYDPLEKQIFFDYQKNRSREGPNTILKHFSGHLQTDGYSGYNEVGARKDVIHLGCMAHARRYFYDARDTDPDRVPWMLKQLQSLYEIEEYARENQLSAQNRYRKRQKEAKPIMKKIKEWLDQQALIVLPQSAMGKAVSYMINQWSHLEIYLTDGRLEIDNNLVENAIRPVALGRKNYLFAGSHKGAKRAAALYTLMANAKIQDVNPFVYLRDVLSRISEHPYKNLDQLLPKNWETSQNTH